MHLLKLAVLKVFIRMLRLRPGLVGRWVGINHPFRNKSPPESGA